VDQMQAYAGDIHDSGIHLLDVINDILDLSKAEAGKLDLRDEVLELEPLIDSVSRTMQPRAQAGEITLSAKLAAELPRLYADERILRQIMLNLLSNAVKFTPPGGQVEIEAARNAEGGLSIGVRDTGIGMAEADIPKALEPFQQIDNKLSRKFQGTGLGLPLVKAMIGAHGGSLHIVSAPGAGTAGAPQKYVFFVSDGVADESNAGCLKTMNNASFGNISPRCQSPINPALCTTLKNRGIKIAVLYTTYLALPTNAWYVAWITPFNTGPYGPSPNSQIAQNMESCASPGLYFEVSPTQGISAAMTTLFQKAVADARISS